MCFDYDFNWNFEYEVPIAKVEEALKFLFAKNYDIDLEKVEAIWKDDWLNFDRLKAEFADELKEHFKDGAYRAYKEWRSEYCEI